jgi:hypothetical protein
LGGDLPAFLLPFYSQIRLHTEYSGLRKLVVCLVQVLEARVDHARVVKIMRNADHLPLVKDYLQAVQKTNLAAVNQAVNQLLIEEEVSLRHADGRGGGGSTAQSSSMHVLKSL